MRDEEKTAKNPDLLPTGDATRLFLPSDATKTAPEPAAVSPTTSEPPAANSAPPTPASPALPRVEGLGDEVEEADPTADQERAVWGNQVQPSKHTRQTSSDSSKPNFDVNSIAVKTPAPTPRSRKKKWLTLLIGLLLVALLVIVGIWSGLFSSLLSREGANNPTQAAQTYYQALLKGERDQLCTVLSPAARGELVAQLSGNPTATAELKLSECQQKIDEKQLREMAKNYGQGLDVSRFAFSEAGSHGNEVTVKVADSKHELPEGKIVTERHSNRWFISPNEKQAAANQ